jgi:1,4-alpha-glucan branching enzyme
VTVPRATPRAPLAIVLHTHMPYVHGYGTWPFGEEWLWEVYASSYLPVTALVERGAQLTVSLTPVLADQLEAPAVGARCRAFYDDDRRRTHTADRDGLATAGLTAERIDPADRRVVFQP